jgi:hypothetical protein
MTIAALPVEEIVSVTIATATACFSRGRWFTIICNRTASYAPIKICSSPRDSPIPAKASRLMSGNGGDGVIAGSIATPSDVAVLPEETSIASNR